MTESLDSHGSGLQPAAGDLVGRLRIVILKRASLWAGGIAGVTSVAFPSAEILLLASAETILAPSKEDLPSLVVVGAGHADCDVWTDVCRLLCGTRRMRVLLLAEVQVAATLRAIAALGPVSLFDPVRECAAVLAHAMRETLAGRVFRSPSIVESMRANPAEWPERWLTRMEERVLELVGAGMSNDEAAAQLKLRAGTVAAHRSSIMRKARVHDGAALVRFAQLHGYVVLSSDGVWSAGPTAEIRRAVAGPLLARSR